MAYLQLLHLAGEPLPSITTSNAIYQYFHIPTTTSIDIASGSVYSLGISEWVYGNGNSVTGFRTGTAGYSMNVNGVLQQSSLYSVVAGNVTLTGPVGGMSIAKNAPITLQTATATTIVSTTRTYAVP